jgi:hypothetical protein
MFLDCRQRKRRKTAQSNPALPSIHVHNHLPGSSARIDTNFGALETPLPMSPPPLAAVKKSPSTSFQQTSHPIQLHDIIDLTNSDDDIIDLTDSDDDIINLTDSDNNDNKDPDGIRYPGIPAMLAELHAEYPVLGFMQYEEVLTGNGFVYISQLVEEQVREQLRDLGICVGVVNLLLAHAERLMRRTQKLKRED